MSQPFDYSEFIGLSRKQLDSKLCGLALKVLSQIEKVERLKRLANEQRDLAFAAKRSWLILRSLLKRFDDGRLTCPLTIEQLKEA